MEVLEKGTGGPDDKAAIFACRKCGAKVKGKKSEGKYVSDWKDGDFVEMECPQCGHVNAVSATLFQL